MYPEQRLLVVVEYLSVELLVFLVGAVVWMLCPQWGSGVEWLRSFRLLLLGLCIVCVWALAVLSIICCVADFLCIHVYSSILRIFLWLVCVGVVDLNRHERTILVDDLLDPVFICKFIAVLVQIKGDGSTSVSLNALLHGVFKAVLALPVYSVLAVLV